MGYFPKVTQQIRVVWEDLKRHTLSCLMYTRNYYQPHTYADKEGDNGDNQDY